MKVVFAISSLLNTTASNLYCDQVDRRNNGMSSLHLLSSFNNGKVLENPLKLSWTIPEIPEGSSDSSMLTDDNFLYNKRRRWQLCIIRGGDGNFV